MIGGALEKGVAAAAKFAGVEVPPDTNAAKDQETIAKIRTALRAKMSRAVPVEGVSVNLEAFIALDNAVKAVVSAAHSAINDRCMKAGLRREFPSNAFSLMIGTGAKGSPVNHTMIVGGLGQQDLEGRRVPVMVSGKTLPSFPSFHPSPRAGGYISDRFLTGLRPQDYFFHCMSGREGLVDTAVKTSRSGYLQRCLVKHLEDLRVEYDHTVRDSEGNLIQFLYGDDGFDVCSTPYLQGGDAQFSFLAKNFQALTFKYALNSDTFQRAGLDMEKAPEVHASVQRARQELDAFNRQRDAWVPAKGDSVKVRLLRDDVLPWTASNVCSVWEEAVVTKVRSKKAVPSVDVKLLTGQKVKKIPLHVPGLRVPHLQPRVPDPVLSQLSKSNHVGVVSERFQDKLESYVERNPDLVLADGSEEADQKAVLSKVAFNLLMWMKAMRSGVDAGEPVGVLAAQSIGEPSTQMTLNTFHLAGGGGVNVTLGIPRLREIVMTASASIKTPTMTLPLLPSLGEDRKLAASAARQLSKLSVADLLATSRHDGGIVVVDQLRPKIVGRATDPAAEWVRSYHVRLYFVDPECIQDAFGLTFADVATAVGKTFTVALFALLAADMRRAGVKLGKGTGGAVADLDAEVGVVNVSTRAAGARGGDGEEGEGGGDDDGGDGAAEEREGGKKKKKSDDDDDDEDDAGADDGNIRLGTRKPVKGYDDDDEEEEEEDQEGGDKDELFDAVVADLDTPVAVVEPKPASKKVKEAAGGTKRVEVPASVAKNKLFGDCLYSESEAWVELVVNFPPSMRKVIMLQTAERAVQKALIRQTKGVTRCFVSTQSPLSVQAEGVNFEAVWALSDIFDVNKIASNDIAAIARCYGVEAARQAITREIKTVFGVYGIAVDPRHLGLIADYMTYCGGYRPLNRAGMGTNSSPYQQMSFETTTHFLASACLYGDTETVKSASARIVMGRVVGSGTGACQLLQPLPL